MCRFAFRHTWKEFFYFCNEFDFKKDFIAPFQGFLKLIEEAYRTEKEIDGIENVIPTEEDFLKANKTPVL